ncbi:MAG TPA: redoxin domain-containing protein [Terriglobia bacterium]|nr:redoxin domain-containing protein [Terriglobia bacterium]
MRERLKAIIFFVVVGSVAGIFVYREANHKGDPGVINVGQKAPDFSIKDESGKLVKLSDFRGKVVFLNFWGTWCQPCVEEMPEIQKLYGMFKDRKFQMLEVSIDNDWPDIHKFYGEHQLALPTYLDPGHQVASLYKVYKFPETFLIDGNGNVRRHTWFEHWSDSRVVTRVDALVKEAEASD